MVELITLVVSLLKNLFSDDKESGPSSRTTVIVLLMTVGLAGYGVYQFHLLQQKHIEQITNLTDKLSDAKDDTADTHVEVMLRDREIVVLGRQLNLHARELDEIKEDTATIKSIVQLLASHIASDKEKPTVDTKTKLELDIDAMQY